MATPRKSEKEYPGYLEDQDRKPFEPTAREEELLSKTVHPENFEDFAKIVTDDIGKLKDRVETLEVRFNELCNMLSVQLANNGFKLLEIRDAEK